VEFLSMVARVSRCGASWLELSEVLRIDGTHVGIHFGCAGGTRI
jgi:hypothetical protein